jgi:NAD(P)H-dependent FMN reductase
MRTAIIAGGHRPQGQTGRVAAYLDDRLRRLLSAEADRIDLGDAPLPLWESRAWDSAQDWPASWAEISQRLHRADAFVFVTPEYGGMASPAIKNFFMFCRRGELAHKPGLIVAVSASAGGAYPVAELRMSSYKNTHVCLIPEHIIVRNVEDALWGEHSDDETDLRLRDRIDYALRMLLSYGEALRGVRESGFPDMERYPYGM